MELNKLQSVVIVGLLVFGASASVCLADDFASLAKQAEHEMDAHHWEASVDLATKSINLKKNSKAYWVRGSSEEELGDVKGAMKDLDEAIALDKENGLAYVTRANLKSNGGNTKSAIEDYNEALRINPKNWSALTLRGDCYNAEGNFNAAISDINKALALMPPDAKQIRAIALLARGAAHGSLAKYKDAVADFDESIACDPTCADAYEERGMAKASLGDKKGAAVDAAKAKQMGQK